MTDEEQLKVNDKGHFLAWTTFFSVESEILNTGGTTGTDGKVTGGTSSIPGVDFVNLLKPHTGKRVKVIIKVLDRK